MILAGGRGVRLRPYTTAFPKPLVPIGDEHAILEIVLRQLAAAGFGSVSIAIGHLGQLIRAYCGDGSQWSLSIDYWPEDEPLGTMGPIVGHLDELPEHFLVMNGDILTDLDFAAVLAGHAASGAALTVATYERCVQVDFGVLELDAEGADRVVAFREKPIEHFSVSMGVYGLSRDALRRFTPGRALGFDDVMLEFLRSGEPPRAHRFGGYWLDIGRPDDYDRANEEWEQLRPRLLPSG